MSFTIQQIHILKLILSRSASMASINNFVTKKYFTSMKQKFTFYVLYHTTNNHFETLDPSRIPTKLLFSQQVLEVKAWYSCHNTSAIILLQQQMQNSRLHPNLIPFQVMSHPLSREVLENPVELIINFCKIYTYIKKAPKELLDKTAKVTLFKNYSKCRI